MRKDLADRVADKFTVGDGCWEWCGWKATNGYARIFYEGRTYAAHRVIYELLKGPILDGLQLDHLCHVRHCVRPDHLEPVTQRENIHRGTAPTAVNARKTHCVHGHPFNAANTIIDPYGSRRCRACRLRS